MRKEIILPPHLYDRIKASAGEHGGIGMVDMFDDFGFPVCAHGHAWGTYRRFETAPWYQYAEPELKKYMSYWRNDFALYDEIAVGERISFRLWCELLNVKRGVESPRVEVVASVVARELAVDPSVAVQ